MALRFSTSARPSPVPTKGLSAQRAGILRRARATLFLLLLAAALMAVVLSSQRLTGAPSPDASASPAAAALLSGNSDVQESTSPSAEEVEPGLPPNAVEIGRFFGFPITNSMIVSWIVAGGLILFAQIATRNMRQVPEGAQNFLEWLVEGLYKFIEGIIGPHLTKRTFWFFATIFIFILAANWFGLVPGVGTIGWGHETAHGFHIDQPLFRGANADVNMTLAMALVFFALWIYWSLDEIGPLGFFKELFGPKGDTTGLMKWLMIVVFFAAGCLEVISILFRPVSLTFRLYGNVFAGENMLEAMAKMAPGFGWLLPVPFYFLELLMGLVQAMVFMLLTAVFTFLMCQHEQSPSPAHA
jgi:F-type H+-transporting ATPase subunit a